MASGVTQTSLRLKSLIAESGITRDDCSVEKKEISFDEVGEGEVLVKVLYLGGDAFIRTMLGSAANNTHGKIKVGDIIPALGLGCVVRSNTDGAKEGDIVSGMMGAASHVVKSLAPGSLMIVPGYQGGLTEEEAKDLLCMKHLTCGLTAYCGLHFVFGPPKENEVVVVSAASGGVGCMASQLAKSKGCKVIGIAGGPHKSEYLLKEVGVDYAIDYKNPSKSVGEQLDEYAPDGIDFFFDNVGGQILDDCLGRIKMGGRVVICGAASQYGGVSMGKVQGPSKYLTLAEKSGKMGGFVVYHHMQEFPKALEAMEELKKAEKLKSLCSVQVGGAENFMDILLQMWGASPCGKLLLSIKQ